MPFVTPAGSSREDRLYDPTTGKEQGKEGKGKITGSLEMWGKRGGIKTKGDPRIFARKHIYIYCVGTRMQEAGRHREEERERERVKEERKDPVAHRGSSNRPSCKKFRATVK